MELNKLNISKEEKEEIKDVQYIYVSYYFQSNTMSSGGGWIILPVQNLNVSKLMYLNIENMVSIIENIKEFNPNTKYSRITILGGDTY